MKLVLLSGGSGKRLWPLSNDARSKQFLKVLEDNKKQQVSMVQRVYSQLEAVGLGDSSVIATSASQVDMIKNQLGDRVSIVIEPERRDTFPAIALSASYLYSECDTGLDEIIGVLPVDPYVENAFFQKVAELEDVLIQSDADLALMGVNPTFPSSKYGYIVPNENHEKSYLKVSHFKEKPSEEEAKKLIKDGALWNCGVFAFKLSFLIKMIEDLNLPTNYQQLKEKYDCFNKNSFDYEVVEKATEIIMLPYKGYWKDLGTWNTLTEEMSTSVMGLGTISEDSKNVHLINELEIPIAVLGGSDLIVAASPDGILVSDKESSPKLKELIVDFDQRPMYEERIWGWYKVLDFVKYKESKEVLTKKICIHAGKNLSYHYHQYRTEVWTVVKGTGELIINNESRVITAGDVIEISPYIKHAVRAIDELEIIEVQRGTNIIEEDIKEPIFSWDEILLTLQVGK
ncbi:Alginate biosynthesis protein AlgA [Bacillus sp. T2.9-1]|uniref:sugar phosphate nucleotidyltransferase n=1 Tax=Bacillus sp. T2.9-1 TaxID=3041163 RepID=UPI0024775155|nr:sugar phosphate nucleotidyltransferase [Bacillus sp. T2.9-1]CAI9395061.1 Alginate biosynthesis protein AlgA [Bacillus sp. T2.9-1]